MPNDITTGKRGAGAVCVTPRGKHHFFGYYDRCPWDRDDQYLLSLETDLMHRVPSADDAAGIGIVDFARDRLYRRVAETYAWNFQEGTKFQWVDGFGEPAFVHNDRREGKFVAVVRNVEGRELRCFSEPVYHVAEQGRRALSVNFSRVARTVAGYGYAGVPDATCHELAPENDGIRLLSLDDGRADLLASFAEIAKFEPSERMAGCEHWIMHLLFNPSGTRFVFIHRWASPFQAAKRQAIRVSLSQIRTRVRNWWPMRMARPLLRILYKTIQTTVFPGYQSRLLVMDSEGKSLRCLANDSIVSHYSWRDDDHLLCWAARPPLGLRYWLFDVRSAEAEVVGEGILDADGHCTYRPDGRWILTDTDGPNEASEHTLILFDTATGTRIDQGNYHTRPELVGAHYRCDLHPRFDRRGRRVCFDSTHEGDRQVYVADVADIVGRQDG